MWAVQFRIFVEEDCHNPFVNGFYADLINKKAKQ